MLRLPSSHRPYLASLAMLALAFTCSPGQADLIPCDTLEQDLGFEGIHENYSTGLEVAIDGDFTVVQEYDGEGGRALHFFHRNDGVWELESEQTWIETDGVVIYPYKSLDISGDTVIASDVSFTYGRVGIFQRHDGQWIQEAAFEVEGETLFGLSVAVSGDVAVVGRCNSFGPTGEAVVYRRDGGSWSVEANLMQTSGEPDTWFGTEVAIHGDTIMVSGLADGVWVFEHDGESWNETQYLQVEGMQLGCSVDLDGDVAILGSYYYDSANEAAVYRYSEGKWFLEQLLESNDPDTQGLGLIVEISGNMAIAVSADWTQQSPREQGKVHVYRHDGVFWEEIEILQKPNLPNAHWPTPRVGLSGQQIAVGYIDDELLSFSSVALYTLPNADSPDGEDCNRNDVCDDLDIASGISQDINNNDIPDECECPADTNGDGTVDGTDVLAVINAWGDCVPDDDCPADVDFDGTVGVNDVLLVISEWGLCE